MRAPDQSFVDLGPDELAAAALESAQSAGCENAAVRVERIRFQLLQLRDGQVETSVDEIELGASCRVVKEGSFGFAASVELGTDSGARLARQSVETAEATRP